MATDPRYEATFGESGQSGHIIFNRLIQRIQIAMGDVLSIGDTAPPGSPNDGDIYILGAAPSGDWSTFAEHDLAVFFTDQSEHGGWVAVTPREGWRAWIQDDNYGVIFNGTSWVANSEGLSGQSRVVSTTSALTSTDDVVNIDTASITVTLPTLASMRRRKLWIVNTSAGSSDLDGNGAETIMGSATLTLAAGASAILFAPSTGTNWLRLS